MKTFGAVVFLAISAALAIPEALTAQTSNLTKQQIESVWRAHLGSFPQDQNEQKALVQQLEAINAKGQQVIECHYGVPGQIYSYVFWHKGAPEGIRQILKSRPSGEDHPFWTLGVNAIDVCPATRETARKLLADSRAGVQSAPPRSAAIARPAATLLKVAPPKIKDVPPVPPTTWQQLSDAVRKSGKTVQTTLVMDVTVGPDGRAIDIVIDNAASVGPMQTVLATSAFDAVRQWVYDMRGLKPPVKFKVTVPFGSSTP
jgi:hypothetical protein